MTSVSSGMSVGIALKSAATIEEAAAQSGMHVQVSATDNRLKQLPSVDTADGTALMSFPYQ